MSRADKSEDTFEEAKRLGSANGLTVTNPSAGCFQMRHVSGWIINMYPRRKGFSPRMYHDRNRPGPFLNLPDNWTLLDAVQAAIEAITPRNPCPNK